MTWLFVSTSPSALTTMPVPAATSLSYWSVVLMSTRPGLTLLTMSCWVLASGASEGAGAGTAPLPGSELPDAGVKNNRTTATASPAASTPTMVCVSQLPLPRRLGSGP